MNTSTQYPVKRIIAGLALSALLSVPSSLCAAGTFTLNLSSEYNWDTAPWVRVSGTGTVPGAGDDIANIEGGSNLYLNGNKEVRSLTAASNNFFRLYNTSETNGALTVSGGMNIQNGYAYIRSSDNAARFTVTTSSLTLGSASAGTTGILDFGGSANYRNVTFAVSGSTVITGNNPGVILGFGLTAADTSIDLGHVIFDNNTGGSIQVGSGVLQAASLRNNGGANGIGDFYHENADAYIAGTLRLYGNGGAANNFGLQIYGGVRVEKTGSNTQIFSRAVGNSYTGGTLISNGVLVITNTEQDTSGIGRGAVEIRGEGTLAGSGYVKLNAAAITVESGGNIAPGADGVAGFNKLTINGENKGSSHLLDMQAGSTFTFDLNATGQNDSIVFAHYTAGDLLLNSGGIAVNVNGILAENTTYTLLTFYSGYEGSGKVSSGLTKGLIMGTGFDGYEATFHYDETAFGGLGAISMTVQAIPEPSVLSLSLVAFGLAAMRRRRK